MRHIFGLGPLVFGIACIVLACVAVRHIDAREEDGAVRLAQVCVHEVSFRTSDDCAAIYAVIDAKARAAGVPFAQYILRHNARTFDPARTGARQWIPHLDESGNAPAHWPEALVPWVTRGRVLWAARLDEARDLLAGRRRHRCTRIPWTWGGEMDRERAARLGLVAIDCGRTVNLFYVRGGR